jgi:hypothetical protein
MPSSPVGPSPAAPAGPAPAAAARQPRPGTTPVASFCAAALGLPWMAVRLVAAVALALWVAGLSTLAVHLGRRRRRAALYARYNRMRAERGLPPLTPAEIEPPVRHG